VPLDTNIVCVDRTHPRRQEQNSEHYRRVPTQRAQGPECPCRVSLIEIELRMMCPITTGCSHTIGNHIRQTEDPLTTGVNSSPTVTSSQYRVLDPLFLRREHPDQPSPSPPASTDEDFYLIVLAFTLFRFGDRGLPFIPDQHVIAATDEFSRWFQYSNR